MAQTSEKPEIPSPAKVRHAEEIMTPLQKTMTKAREEVLKHMKDFLGAGVSEPQVQNAVRKAEERAQLEFEEKEKQDPLLQIEKILRDAAETPDEMFLAQRAIEQLVYLRTGWKEKLRKERLKAKNKNEPFDLKKAIFDELRLDHLLPTLLDRRLGTDNQSEYFPTTRILHGIIKDGETREIKPSQAFVERVLKGMGALEQDGKFDDLRLLPTVPGTRGPVYDGSFARRVPTDIEGVDVDVKIDRSSEIAVSMDLATLEKIVSLPS